MAVGIRPYLLRILVIEMVIPSVVVTVFRTRKIRKYRRE